MATKANLYIDQGSTFVASIELFDEADNPVVVTGYSANSQIRKHYSSTNSVSFACALTNGLLTLTLTANSTALLSAGRYVYDVVLNTPSNTTIRLVEGIVTVNPMVTR